MGRRNRKSIGYKKERVVLSDVLPYEVPPYFSNRHFYNFLIDNKVQFKDDKIYFRANKTSIEDAVKLLFGLEMSSLVYSDSSLGLKYIEISPEQLKSIPFKFRISHKQNDYRELSIIHPLNQLALIPFYDKHKNDIIYHSSRSSFSLRRPTRIASLKYYKDSTHKKNKAENPEIQIIETSDKEYISLKTYFSYEDYSNIYKFYEDHKFHRAEKYFDNLLKFDISRCFDSIYTHSISWALINKKIVKKNVRRVDTSFGGKFDKIMQRMNYNETNGIVIGPEFSRIFAELILQKIDSNVQSDLLEKELEYKVHYDIFRYVDDFFVFSNDESVQKEVLAQYKIRLKEYNLFFNDAKTELLEKPIITKISVAKEEIRELLEKTTIFRFQRSSDDSQKALGATYNNANDVITNYKKLLSQTQTSYKDLQNYFLAAIFNKTKSLISSYQKLERSIIRDLLKEKDLIEKLDTETNDSEKEKLSERLSKIQEKLEENIKDIGKFNKKIDRKFIEIVDLTFFVYSVLPRVSYSIKVCHILHRITDFIQNQEKFKSRISGHPEFGFILNKINVGLSFDKKHSIYKTVYDGVSIVLRKSGNSKYSEVETLYLLAVLSKLGDNYKLSENKLIKHFKLDSKEECTYFLIVSLLHYIKDKRDYWELRKILKKHIKKKLNNYDNSNAEQVILLLDLLSCPYIETKESDNEDFKTKILTLAKFYNGNTTRAVKLAKLRELLAIQDSWFVKWKQADLGRELNTKRGHEVY